MTGNINEYYWEPPDKSFTPLMMKAYCNAEAAEHKYRIYKSQSEFEEVDAMYASEAIEKSDIEKPVKVERVGLKLESFIIPEGNIKFVEAKEEAENVTSKETSSATENSEQEVQADSINEEQQISKEQNESLETEDETSEAE